MTVCSRSIDHVCAVSRLPLKSAEEFHYNINGSCVDSTWIRSHFSDSLCCGTRWWDDDRYSDVAVCLWHVRRCAWVDFVTRSRSDGSFAVVFSIIWKPLVNSHRLCHFSVGQSCSFLSGNCHHVRLGIQADKNVLKPSKNNPKTTEINHTHHHQVAFLLHEIFSWIGFGALTAS